MWCYPQDKVRTTDEYFGADDGVEVVEVGEPGNGTAIFRVSIDLGGIESNRQVPLRLRDGKWCVGRDRPGA